MDGRSASTAPRPYRHLPAGRQPGPQTRRAGTARAVGWGIGAIFGAGCLGTIYLPIVVATAYLVGYAATHLGEVALAGWGILLFSVALTLGIPYGGWLAYRRFIRPPESTHFALEASPLELSRGQEVEARLAVSDVERLSEEAQVGLVCTVFYDRWHRTTDSDGHSRRTRGTDKAVAYEDWRPAQRMMGTQRFTFTIPPDAPFSHEGDCVSFAWAVAAREPVQLGRDPRRDEPIWVTP